MLADKAPHEHQPQYGVARTKPLPPDQPPADFFHYSADSQVLICIGCRYAVQPDAVARHLKDIHHILRSRRKPYMDYVNTFKLKDPSDVVPPSSFPVPYLPVEDGWSCTAPACNYLCASIKRMQNHWPARHGRKGYEGNDWRPVQLQTFFRGNMLRYFSNTCHKSDPVNNLTASTTDKDARFDQGFPTSEESEARMVEKYRLDHMDTALLRHYFTNTYQSFMIEGDDSLKDIWLKIVPYFALDHQFLLHGILACTALHLSYLDPANSNEYRVRALLHQESALPIYRQALSHPDSNNCNVLMTFGHLLTVYTLALELDNDDSALFVLGSPDSRWADEPLVLPTWLHFLRCGCVMLCDFWHLIETGPIMALADAWEVDAEDDDIKNGKEPYLLYFMSLASRASDWSEQVLNTYHDAAKLLAETFAYNNSTNPKYSHSAWSLLGMWPAKLDEAFIALVAERHPAALILLAHYCVAMKRLDGNWYLRGRARKLLLSILQSLDESWHPSLADVVKQVLQ